MEWVSDTTGNNEDNSNSNDDSRIADDNYISFFSKNRKRPAYSTNEGLNRSVVDYDTEEQIREALYTFMNEITNVDDTNLFDVTNENYDDEIHADVTSSTTTTTAKRPTASGCSFQSQVNTLLAEINDDVRQPIHKVTKLCQVQQDLAERSDWILPGVDLETCYPQTVYDEIQRLKSLKTFFIVDSAREEAFDRITSLASRIFDVPISTVTLIDLGRQFLMANHGLEKFGLGDLRDAPRKLALCTHTILQKTNVLVVPDLTKDFRFMDNPFVTDPPHAKFYAGAPLISPEGYKLGTICIVDVVPRPNGLNEDEQSTLMDLAEMTMKVMIDRRDQLNNKILNEKRKEKETEKDTMKEFVASKNENQDEVASNKPTPSNSTDTHLLMTYAAHDMLAPLTSVHLSLSLLQNDLRHILNDHQFELLKTASTCSELMLQICKCTLDGLSVGTSSSSSNNLLLQANGTATSETTARPVMQKQTTNLKNLVTNIQVIVDPLPKKVPCIVTLNPNVPNIVISDELNLFRCAMNLLINAIHRTDNGSVHLTIDWDGDSLLLFECEDTAPDIPLDEIQYLFQQQGDTNNDDSYRGTVNSTNLRVGLSSIASLIDSMDGEYGFRPKDVDTEGNYIVSPNGRRKTGSIFWFSIPLLLHKDDDERDASGATPATTSTEMGTSHNDTMNHLAPSNDGMASPTTNADVLDELGKLALDLNASISDFDPYPIGTSRTTTITDLNPTSGNIRKRRALVIDDSVVIRRSLGQALSHLGYELTFACDGFEGLQELQKMLFDIVFIDFIMPVTDGLTCVRIFRNWEKLNRSWDSQLILGISGDADFNNNGQALHAGINAFLPKPITVKTLSDLECSSEFVLRTRQLDEWESNRHFQNSNITGLDTTKTGNLEQQTFNMSVTSSVVNPPQQMLNASYAPICKVTTPTDPTTGRTCLVATNSMNPHNNSLRQHLESIGWQVLFVHDGIRCLEFLKLQSWGAVLIDNDLSQLSGLQCITAFRKWEEMNRTHRSMHIYLVCDGNIPSPSDGTSFVQPPLGCNGVLRRPVPWTDLQYMLLRNTTQTVNYGTTGTTFGGPIVQQPQSTNHFAMPSSTSSSIVRDSNLNGINNFESSGNWGW